MRQMRKLAILLCMIALCATGVRAGNNQALSAADRATIEALIASVETLPDARFVRNGKEYGAGTAAKFLRGKWKDRARHLRSVDDFIDKIATRSSTTNRPYLIRFNDGREIASAAFLRSELKGIRGDW